MSKRAILIGCNYTSTPSIQLSGCINDIINVRNTLVDAYGYSDSNIYSLRDDETNRNLLPTKANILNSLKQIVAMSLKNDMVWVHYSGHGTQIKDTNGDEVDGFDECIVPCDYNTAGIITDDELFAIFRNAKCSMIICLDSCHSGSGCDLQYSIRYNNGTLTKSAIGSSRSIPNTNIIMLSGCRDEQTSADAYDYSSKRGVGAFTQVLLETLRSNDHNIAILPLYIKLCSNLKLYGFTQVPVLSSSAVLPAFQFARANANGTTVVTSNSTSNLKGKDFPLYDGKLSNSSYTNTLRRRMSDLFH